MLIIVQPGVVLSRYDYSGNIIFQRYIIVNDMYCQQVQTHILIKQKQSTNIMNNISKALL